MPQMAPSMWLMLTLSLIICILIIMSKLFFSTMNNNIDYTEKKMNTPLLIWKL